MMRMDPRRELQDIWKTFMRTLADIRRKTQNIMQNVEHEEQKEKTEDIHTRIKSL